MMAATNEKCQAGCPHPREAHVMRGIHVVCEYCYTEFRDAGHNSVTAWHEFDTLASLRARIAELEQGIAMHHCKPPLGNQTREEAIVRIAELEDELAVIKNYGGENDHGYQTRGNFDAKCRVCGDHERVCGTAYRSADRARRAAQRSADAISAKLSEVCERLILAESERLTDEAIDKIVQTIAEAVDRVRKAPSLSISLSRGWIAGIIRAARGAKEKA